MSINLPRGWANASLEEVFEPRSSRVSPIEFAESPYIGLEHVEAHTNRLLATVPAGTMSSSAARFFANDVLYGRMRPYLNKVVSPQFDGLASAEFIVFPITKGIDNKFLLWRLSSNDFVEFACSQYEGDRPRVKFDQLGKFELRLPPTAEQIRIVEKLEELFSDLDAGVAELKTAQKKLAQYRQSLLKSAVDGSLTAQWRAEAKVSVGKTANETGPQLLARILRERRARWEAKQLAKFKEQGKTPPKDWQDKYPEPVQPDTSDLPALPEGWVWATIDQLSLEQRYGSSAKTGAGSDGVPVIRMGNIQDGELDFQDLKYLPVDHDEFPALFLADGDLLFNRTNSPELVGKTAVYRSQIAPCSYASYLIAVRFSECFIPEFAAAYINSVCGRQWIKSVATQQVGQANVNGTKLAALTIPLPPMDEQSEIVRLLLEQRKASFEQAVNIEIGLKQSAAQRKNILKAAFSGQLVPQDPNDEPAGVLLERIRAELAEREKQPKSRKTKARKEIAAVVSKLIDVLAEAGDWVPAQEAFRRCGVADGAQTDQIEALYAELRDLDKSRRLAVEPVTDAQGRKLYDRLKLVATA